MGFARLMAEAVNAAYCCSRLQTHSARPSERRSHCAGSKFWRKSLFSSGFLGKHNFVSGITPSFLEMTASFPGNLSGFQGEVAYFQGKVARFPRRVGDFPRRVGSFPGKVAGFPRRVGDFPRRVGSFPGKVAGFPGRVGDFPRRVGSFPGKVDRFPRKVDRLLSKGTISPRPTNGSPGRAVELPWPGDKA